ncbi:MAG: Cof-type HAD-IIB family hydrolase [Eubacterium coprostanoligenes]|uniref:Cof-type HAD-IIB family hydrolase n=1 Tax=Eubacterium coprostanoligenes TaxID=290054 RepID=UPI0023531110|nr:Cof-type HAD-IIB family hydrolase [Eubacterium coprostanoligenes]MCI7264597.1 Cof-type HAD-IIB family hydrolase [Eubacterium coprostanoligenes]
MTTSLKSTPKSAKKSELWKFLKFNICVVVTSVLDIVSYMFMLYVVFKSQCNTPLPESALLSLLGIRYKGYLYSYLISTSIGYIAAYLINRKVTFKSNINPLYSSVLYAALAIFNILVSSYLGGVFGTYIASHGISSPIIEMVSKFIIINIPTIWTYPLERYIIQINKKERQVQKMPMIIASDLDGTLLKSNTDISEENLRAIERLAQKGAKIILLTGRTLYEVPKELRICKGVEYIVFSNGAGIYHREKGIIEYRTISNETAFKIYKVLNEYKTFVELYTNGAPYVETVDFSQESFEYYKIDSQFIPEMYKSRRTCDSIKDLIFDLDFKTEMFDVFFRNQDERSECYERLKREFDEIEITTSMTNNLEIMLKGINKGSALRELCQIAGFDIKDVTVVGDSKNDLTAFNTEAKKYAVANACEEIKALADKIICSNDENIMCYIEREAV